MIHPQASASFAASSGLRPSKNKSVNHSICSSVILCLRDGRTAGD
jgi:hypothetical protein